MDSETIAKARDLWDYFSSFKTTRRSDAIVLCCSYDLRVCDHACDLLRQGFSDRMVITGKSGNWTRHIWSKPEAHVFAERALANGIDAAQILIEPEATNFGENVVLAKALVPEARTATFVSKPNSLLRIKLTVEAQWPDLEGYVSCPGVEFPGGVSNIVGVLGVINEMVGDIERIQRYPELGFQASHVLPKRVLRSWGYLVEQGFTEHMM